MGLTKGASEGNEDDAKRVALIQKTASADAENYAAFRMGFADFEEKFQRLLKIWPVIRSMDLRSIDCTIPEKVFVQPVRSDKMKTRQHKTRRQQSK